MQWRYILNVRACFNPQAFELLCDLLLLYSVNSVRSEPALQSLVHLPSDSLRSELAAFLLDYVFTDAEDAEPDGTLAPNDEKYPLLVNICINCVDNSDSSVTDTLFSFF